MGLAILGVIALLYFVLAYLAAKTWPAWHVVILVFLFLASLCCLMFTAAMLKLQERWRSQYEKSVASIEQEQETQGRLKLGSVSTGEPGELQLRGELSRMMADRGRVWRNMRLAQVGEGQLIFDPSGWNDAGCGVSAQSEGEDTDEAAPEAAEADAAAPTAAPAAASPPAIGLQADTVVYAFKQVPLSALPEPLRAVLTRANAEGATELPALCPVPSVYMGEFKVVSNPQADARAITLAPTIPLTESQVQQLQEAQTAWTFYEVMPMDDHVTLKGLSAEQLQLLLPAGAMTADRYNQLLSDYQRDQAAAEATDPPERKWTKVRFQSEEPVVVEVDFQGAVEGQDPLTGTEFDPTGRTVIATLQQGSKTEFHKGDEVWLDFATAQDLVNQGRAEVVETIYQRRLRDYAQIFRTYSAQLDEMGRQIAMAQTDLDKLTSSIDQQQKQIAYQTQQFEKLQADRDGLKSELQVVTQHRTALETKLNELRGELSRLYRTNRQLVSQMSQSP